MAHNVQILHASDRYNLLSCRAIGARGGMAERGYKSVVQLSVCVSARDKDQPLGIFH